MNNRGKWSNTVRMGLFPLYSMPSVGFIHFLSVCCLWKEDEALREKVEEQGEKRDWKEVARHVGTRTAKQCNDRWNKSLNPSLEKEEAGSRGKWSNTVRMGLLPLYSMPSAVLFIFSFCLLALEGGRGVEGEGGGARREEGLEGGGPPCGYQNCKAVQ